MEAKVLCRGKCSETVRLPEARWSQNSLAGKGSLCWGSSERLLASSWFKLLNSLLLSFPVPLIAMEEKVVVLVLVLVLVLLPLLVLLLPVTQA